MPKIDAPTVREHHAMVKAKLIAATEEILHEIPIELLQSLGQFPLFFVIIHQESMKNILFEG